MITAIGIHHECEFTEQYISCHELLELDQVYNTKHFNFQFRKTGQNLGQSNNSRTKQGEQ